MKSFGPCDCRTACSFRVVFRPEFQLESPLFNFTFRIDLTEELLARGGITPPSALLDFEYVLIKSIQITPCISSLFCSDCLLLEEFH